MSVDFFPCGVCKETICDAGEYYSCSKCEENICEVCYKGQVKLYKRVKKGSEQEEFWGESALRECDCCSDKTKPARIAELKRKLAELEK